LLLSRSGGQAFFGMLEQHVLAKGSALVALRPLADEELFVDHTLNPFARRGRSLPPWAERQWAERRDLRRLSGTLPPQAAAALRAEEAAARVRDEGAARAELGAARAAAEAARLR